MHLYYQRAPIYSVLLTISVLLNSCTSNKQIDIWFNAEQDFDVQEIFNSERFPNIVTATDGSLLATWGRTKVVAKRSEDGGETWSEEIVIADPGFHGGGTTVDENTGNIFAFVEESHPVAPLHIYISKDHGKTWSEHNYELLPDANGNTPAMHLNEHGTTLMRGEYAGRIIRPSRYYGKTNDRSEWPEHYTNAIYSDDGGDTWKTSNPFPANGTGEATLVELSDGTIYYNSRRHLSTDGLNPKMRHIAWSKDGGETWGDLTVSDELPDGDQNRDYGLMAGLVRLPIDGRDILLFSNIESMEGRHHGTVWASFDGGKTWPVKRLVDEGSFAYSSLTVGREGTASEGMINLCYESDGGAKVARFNMAWLLDGKDWQVFIN
ncbi:MAG: exo-alpha-sialidase [Cyclobacteriaceae bacterium]